MITCASVSLSECHYIPQTLDASETKSWDVALQALATYTTGFSWAGTLACRRMQDVRPLLSIHRQCGWILGPGAPNHGSFVNLPHSPLVPLNLLQPNLLVLPSWGTDGGVLCPSPNRCDVQHPGTHQPVCVHSSRCGGYQCPGHCCLRAGQRS